MKKLKVCFVGIGSIAKRHIKNLSDLCNKKGTSLHLDILRHSEKILEDDIKDYVNECYFDSNELPYDYDVIFITNPTSKHLDTIKEMQDKGRHFFIEKPVVSVDMLDRVGEITIKEDSIYYVACPLRYSNVIEYIKNNINVDDVISIRCMSSSYLPDWRPGTDYRNTYSARRELGGGVAIDLIHEWDYIKYIFGAPQNVLSLKGKKSNLEITSEDIAIYIAEYENMFVELHLDYFGRKTMRQIMIFTHDDTIIGDLIDNSVTYLVSGKKIDFNEVRNDFYVKEMQHFLDMIEGKIVSDNNIIDAVNTMQIGKGD